MSLTKVTYTDSETVIHAANLNEIQDEIIANSTEVKEVSNQTELLDALNAETIPYKILATNKYIKANNGEAANFSQAECTDFINISGYDYLVYSRYWITSNSTQGGIAFYSAASVESYLDGEPGLAKATQAAYVDTVIKIPSGANYVRCTLLKSATGGFYVKGIKSNPLKGLKLSVLGDSISAFTGQIPAGNDAYYTGSNAGVISVNEMWWKVLCSNTGMEPWVIDAWSGSSIAYNFATDSSHSDTNKIPMCSDLRTGRLAKDNVDPDIIIIAGGTNDWTYSESTTTPLGDWYGRTGVRRTDVLAGNSTFMESYASLIDKLHEEYPGAIVVGTSMFYTCRGTAISNGLVRLNNRELTLNDYSDAVERVCKIMGVPYIDVFNVGFTYGNYYPTYAEDSSTIPTHPNARGQAVIAKRFIDELPRLVKQFR